MHRSYPKKMWFDFQLNLHARYSGGRRGGGTLAKGAAVAWGAYQVEVFFLERIRDKTCSDGNSDRKVGRLGT